ncbi:hypothetical protein LTR17_000046 [Elasticomyces elasticus]|nr:hypothetical protein LTR17_000046 [Elasticomyces elasticus]
MSAADRLRALLFDNPFAVEATEPRDVRTDFSSKPGQSLGQPKIVDPKKKAAKLEKRAFKLKKRETELLACEAAAGERETLLALKESYNKDLANEIDDRSGIVIDWERVLEQREEAVTEREEALKVATRGGLSDEEYRSEIGGEAFAEILFKTQDLLEGEQLAAWKVHMAGIKKLMEVAIKKADVMREAQAIAEHEASMKVVGLTLPEPTKEDHLAYSDESDDESVEAEATMEELKADEAHNAKMHAIGLTLPDPTDEDHLEYSDDSN